MKNAKINAILFALIEVIVASSNDIIWISLSNFVYPSRDQMVILQDSARILQKLSILHDLAEKWLSCKICQKNGYLARSARKMVILQDSCKFVPVELSSYWLLFMQHISFWPEIYFRISCVFLKKNNKFI